MSNLINTLDLLNYDPQSSNSNNYGTSQNTSSPESFPVLMEEGIIVQYELMKFSSEIIAEIEVVKD